MNSFDYFDLNRETALFKVVFSSSNVCLNVTKCFLMPKPNQTASDEVKISPRLDHIPNLMP